MKRPQVLGYILLFFLFIVTKDVIADVQMPSYYGDGMVIQRDHPIRIAGSAASGEKLTIVFAGKTRSCTAGTDGNWKVFFSPLKAGGPYTLVIKGRNELSFKNILMGDVWLCAGQSNMVLSLERVRDLYPHEANGTAVLPIRNFTVTAAADVIKPHSSLPGGKWQVASTENVYSFGAVSWFFARSLFDNYKVPVGIINCSVGGTPAQAWIAEEALKRFPQYYKQILLLKDSDVLNRAVKEGKQAAAYPADNDTGLKATPAWSSERLSTNDWNTFWMPGYWEDQGIRGLDGAVWFRKSIFLPDSLAAKAGSLNLGRIVDADECYLNGRLIGSTSYQYPPRKYAVPTGLLHAGENILVLRIRNFAGKGGFVPDKTYELNVQNVKIDLRGEWLYKVGQVYDNRGAKVYDSFQQQNQPSALYNTMIAPLRGIALRGIIWYQGESNTGLPSDYQDLLETLIYDWRRLFNNKTLPFIYAQLPSFGEKQYLPYESNWALLREAQRRAMRVPNTAMSVNLDLGEWNDIHPFRKKELGERLALLARRLSYHENIIASGPELTAAHVKANIVTLSFDQEIAGCPEQETEENAFELAGTDGVFYKAVVSKIANRTLRLHAEQVKVPVMLRYAWADNPRHATVRNVSGLYLSPFQQKL